MIRDGEGTLVLYSIPGLIKGMFSDKLMQGSPEVRGSSYLIIQIMKI